MSDEQIEAAIEAIQAMLAAREAGEHAKVIDAVPEPVALPAPSRKPRRKRGGEAKASLLPNSRGKATSSPASQPIRYAHHRLPLAAIVVGSTILPTSRREADEWACVGTRARCVPGRDAGSIPVKKDGTSPRSIFSIRPFLIATAKACPTSSAMLKSRDIAMSPSSPIARDVSGTSVATSLPRYRIISAIFAEGPVWPTIWRTSSVFCSRTWVGPQQKDPEKE